MRDEANLHPDPAMRTFPRGRRRNGEYCRDTAGPSLMSRAEYNLICTTLGLKCHTVLEIGTWCGATAATLADFRPGVQFISIDPFVSELHQMLWIANAYLRPNMLLWRGTSASFFRIAGDATADGAIVDGDHSEEGGFRDLLGCGRVVCPDGFIAVHDYDPGSIPSVVRAVDRFCEQTVWKIVDQAETLVVLRRKLP